MLPKHVRYQTALHPVVPVSLACPAGDFLSIHPFQQFVNPQMNFFADFLILFGRFSENPRKCPLFRHFFASPCRSSGAFSAHILLQSLLRDHAEAQKGGSSRNLGGRTAWGRVCGRAKLGAGTLRCLRLCWRLPWDWLDAEQLGRCPKPHETLSLDPARGRRKGTKSPP